MVAPDCAEARSNLHSAWDRSAAEESATVALPLKGVTSPSRREGEKYLTLRLALSPLRGGHYAMVGMRPPSTRNAAPLVADESGLAR